MGENKLSMRSVYGITNDPKHMPIVWSLNYEDIYQKALKYHQETGAAVYIIERRETEYVIDWFDAVKEEK